MVSNWHAQELAKQPLEKALLAQIPNYKITNDQVGKCRTGKTNLVFKCMVSDEHQQCPSYACGNKGNDPECILNHPHPVTRTEWKDEHGLCTYVKQCSMLRTKVYVYVACGDVYRLSTG